MMNFCYSSSLVTSPTFLLSILSAYCMPSNASGIKAAAKTCPLCFLPPGSPESRWKQVVHKIAEYPREALDTQMPK